MRGMAAVFFPVEGDPVADRDLTIPKARQLAIALAAEAVEYAALVECRRRAADEVVVFDVEVEVPQCRVHPIRPRERVAVTFWRSDRLAPEIEALRTDFPLVPHLNLRAPGRPRSICLYEEPYESVKLRWTAPRFVHELRRWMALTAKGELHREEQPLEPFIVGYAGHIVLPHDLDFGGDAPERLYITEDRSSSEGGHFLIAQTTPPPAKAPSFVVSAHGCQPQVHGIIHWQPTTLATLADLVEPAGLDLLSETRSRLKRWYLENRDRSLFDCRLIYVMRFPLVREPGGAVERIDASAFLLGDTVRDIGVKLGIWYQVEKDLGLGVAVGANGSKRGEDIAVHMLNVMRELTRPLARTMNGLSPCQEPQLLAVGVGALGSQVVMNLARSAFGKWTLIDHDVLMPHNVARHALPAWFVGRSKAEALAHMANAIVADSTSFTALPVDVLRPGEREPDVADAYQAADAIIDMSASVPVARHLACDVDVTARRLSLFLTPNGENLVLIAEDDKRTFRLDALEMQYYRALARDPQLEGMSAPAPGQRRYGQSCRDVTSTLPQSLVARHSAIAAGATEMILTRPEAAIAIWRADAEGNTRHLDVQPAPVLRHQVGQWTVVADEGLLRRLSELREAKLPNETGGVLLGSFDVQRGLVYIVDTVPSPPDSEEWSTLYIRGCRGLNEEVQSLTAKTDGMLEYVGEWHSHPKGASTAPGTDDRRVFAWLADHMAREGLPPVILIVGEPGRVSCFVGKIGRRENLLLGVSDE